MSMMKTQEMRATIGNQASNPFYLQQQENKKNSFNLEEQQKIDLLFSASYTDFNFYKIEAQIREEEREKEQQKLYNKP